MPPLTARIRIRALLSPRGSGVRRFGSTVPPARGDFARLAAEDLAAFRRILGGPDHVITEEGTVKAHNQDWLGRYAGRGEVVLRPGSTEEVAATLKYCNERRIAVVPQGGNTGLVGGSVPVHDEVVLSMSRMNRILDFDPVSGVLSAEAGVVLQQAMEVVNAHGFAFPLDLGAKGSCQLGGNVSTNAGGIRYVRFGSLHGSILGLEAVLASGEVLDLRNACRKDNTGPALHHLFIGSEGALGVVTQVNVLCPRSPHHARRSDGSVVYRPPHVSLLGFPTFAGVLRALQQVRAGLLHTLTAVECMDRRAFDLACAGSATRATMANPLAGETAVSQWVMLVEFANAPSTEAGVEPGSQPRGEDGVPPEFLAVVEALEGSYSAAVLAQSDEQRQQLWSIREEVPLALRRWPTTYKYDISLPVDAFEDMVRRTQARIGAAEIGPMTGGYAGADAPAQAARMLPSSLPELAGLEVAALGYGHLADGNLHLTVGASADDDRLQARLEPWVFEEVRALGGSISAEHGLGQQKNNHIGYSKSPAAVRTMHRLKRLFDPNGVLNPYKVLPDAVASDL